MLELIDEVNFGCVEYLDSCYCLCVIELLAINRRSMTISGLLSAKNDAYTFSFKYIPYRTILLFMMN